MMNEKRRLTAEEVCARKRMFPTATAAASFAKTLNLGYVQKPYHCSVCGQYHLHTCK